MLAMQCRGHGEKILFQSFFPKEFFVSIILSAFIFKEDC